MELGGQIKGQPSMDQIQRGDNYSNYRIGEVHIFYPPQPPDGAGGARYGSPPAPSGGFRGDKDRPSPI